MKRIETELDFKDIRKCRLLVYDDVRRAKLKKKGLISLDDADIEIAEFQLDQFKASNKQPESVVKLDLAV